jgi:hypothetical protein
MLYTLFLWIYISFGLNGHIKTKNGYFHKILNIINYKPVKSESLKISLQTNMIYIHQQFF